ncbi:MAG: hypothetical protein HY692_03345 [Cyanobacteria bacterium NC_groundwater_1444_Ag_S-0.65um_54_12]|nr:hypothetical protein [Cyanobacteria bacterium NC_groundwater_1444_Ag_S-0.65um_54_12]
MGKTVGKPVLRAIPWPSGAMFLLIYSFRKYITAETTARTELKLANAQLQLMVEELSHADRIRGEFLDTVSHDLRIPLTTNWLRRVTGG